MSKTATLQIERLGFRPVIGKGSECIVRATVRIGSKIIGSRQSEAIGWEDATEAAIRGAKIQAIQQIASVDGTKAMDLPIEQLEKATHGNLPALQAIYEKILEVRKLSA